MKQRPSDGICFENVGPLPVEYMGWTVDGQEPVLVTKDHPQYEEAKAYCDAKWKRTLESWREK